MSALRKPFRLTIDGETHDIVTSARDMAVIETGPDAEPMPAAEMTFRLLHAACTRLELAGIPHDYEKFVDLLDEVQDLDGIPAGRPAGGEIADPTRPAGSAG